MHTSTGKLTALLLALAMLLTLAACSGGSDTPAAPESASPAPAADETPNTPPAEDETPATRTVTDALGRQVEVPAVVERIVPLGNAARLGTYLGLQDKFVTISQGDLNETPYMAYGWYNREAWSALPLAATGGYGEFHPEVILEADPDLILCTFEPDIVANIEEQTGLPVVAVAQGTLFGADYDEALRILGEACGVSERAEAVVSFIHACLDDLDARTKDIPAADKPLLLGAAATFRGGHGISGVYVDFPVFRAIAANDAAAGLEKESFDTGVEVDREQILLWDPAVIFLDAGNLGLVSAEYGEDAAYFAQLSAVQNGKLYQWPNSTANYTNLEIPLASAYYAGTILYPEAFADVDFEAKAEEIFQFFLGHAGYLQVLEEHSCGYGPVTLGV